MGDTIPQQAAREMDEMLASVMPDTWLGHARLAIEESDLSDETRTLAMRLAERLSSKHPDKSAEAVAQVAMKKAREM